MYQRLSAFVLHWLKVPPEPHPPAGDPASLRVFRAGQNYLRLRLVGWAVPQVFALAAIVFWTVVLLDVETGVHARTQSLPAPHPPALTPASALATVTAATTVPPAQPGAKPARKKVRASSWAEFKSLLVNLALLLPAWGFLVIWLLKLGGVLLYLAQIPLTFAIRRLDYDLRWYVVTDRSLRIRTGVWKVQELTMSFANIQQVTVEQGPLQRLLGLADVRVQSAGGGSNPHQPGAGPSLHTGIFHSVTNAAEIRDLIQERLRQFRATGLGHPEELAPIEPAPPPRPAADATLFAARELLAEAAALRRTLAS